MKRKSKSLFDGWSEFGDMAPKISTAKSFSAVIPFSSGSQLAIFGLVPINAALCHLDEKLASRTSESQPHFLSLRQSLRISSDARFRHKMRPDQGEARSRTSPDPFAVDTICKTKCACSGSDRKKASEHTRITAKGQVPGGEYPVLPRLIRGFSTGSTGEMLV